MKMRSQNETGFGNQNTGKYIPLHIRNINFGKNIDPKECKLFKRANHLRFCPNNKEKNETRASQNQS